MISLALSVASIVVLYAVVGALLVIAAASAAGATIAVKKAAKQKAEEAANEVAEESANEEPKGEEPVAQEEAEEEKPEEPVREEEPQEEPVAEEEPVQEEEPIAEEQPAEEPVEEPQEEPKEEQLSLKESLAKAKETETHNARTKADIARILGDEFGDKVELNTRGNETKTGLPLADTHYFVHEDSKSCFVYVYQAGGTIVLLLRLEDEDADKVREQGHELQRSAFPKSKNSWYSVVLEDSYSDEDIRKLFAAAYGADLHDQSAEEPQEEPAAEEPQQEDEPVQEEQPEQEELPPIIIESDDGGKSGTIPAVYCDFTAYSRSFESKLRQANDQTRDYYDQLKNKLLSYKNVHDRMSWQRESFRLGRALKAALTIRGKTLCLFVALDPNEYDQNLYHQKDFSDKASWRDVPMMLRVKSPLGLKRALAIIEILMQASDVPVNPNAEAADQLAALPKATDEALLADGLIKKVIRRRRVVRQEGETLEQAVARMQRELFAKDADEVDEPQEEEDAEQEEQAAVVAPVVTPEPVAEKPKQEEPAEEAQPEEEPVQEDAPEVEEQADAERHPELVEGPQGQNEPEVEEQPQEEPLPEQPDQEELTAEELVDELDVDIPEQAEEQADARRHPELVEGHQGQNEPEVEEQPQEEVAEAPQEEPAPEEQPEPTAEDLADELDIDIPEEPKQEEQEPAPVEQPEEPVQEEEAEEDLDVDVAPVVQQAEEQADAERHPELVEGPQGQNEPEVEEQPQEEVAEAPQEEPAPEEQPEPTAEELADELDVDIPEQAEEQADARRHPELVEGPQGQNEPAVEEQPQEEPVEEKAPEQAPAQEEPAQIEEPKQEEAPKKKEVQPEPEVKEEKQQTIIVGGKPLPKGLYDDVPEKKEKSQPKHEEPKAEEVKEEPQEEKPHELSEDEKALQALMKESEEEEAEEERKRQEAEERDRIADENRIPLEQIMADPRFDEFTQMQKKLFATTSNHRNLYSELKNTLLTFKKVRCKESNAGDSFRQGGKLIARITLNNDVLRLHLCLNPSQYNPRVYHHYSLEKYGAYREVPFTVDVGDEDQLQIAMSLIKEAMSSKYLLYVNEKRERVDYAALYTLGPDGSIPEQPKPVEDEEEQE